MKRLGTLQGNQGGSLFLRAANDHIGGIKVEIGICLTVDGFFRCLVQLVQRLKIGVEHIIDIHICQSLGGFIAVVVHVLGAGENIDTAAGAKNTGDTGRSRRAFHRNKAETFFKAFCQCLVFKGIVISGQQRSLPEELTVVDRFGGYHTHNAIRIAQDVNCYSTANVTVDSDEAYIGGLVGYNDCPTVNCYAAGKIIVNGEDCYVGGVAGYSDSEATNCYYLVHDDADGTKDINVGISAIGYDDGGTTTACCALDYTQMKAASGEADALADKLNAFVTADNGVNGYKQWYVDSTYNNGYPCFDRVTLKIADGITNGTVEAGSLIAAPGELVTLTVTPDAGYKLDTLAVTDSTGHPVPLRELGETTYAFIMPEASPVTVSAVFAAIKPAVYHSVTVADAEHGSVSADKETAMAGTVVTVSVKAETGYQLESLTVTDAGGKEFALSTVKKDETYSFYMPAGDVTVTAVFAPINPFTDVKESAYYYDAVLWAKDEGVTGGVDATHFDPRGTTTRAQMVTFLWRAAGCPVVNYAMSFTDVSGYAYYAEAVRWAVSEGITKGVTDTLFMPNRTVTRAQAVTFLWRYAGSSAVTANNPFTDVAESAYYYDAVLWAKDEGITGGVDETHFAPGKGCTRAQIVSFLYRLFNR